MSVRVPDGTSVAQWDWRRVVAEARLENACVEQEGAITAITSQINVELVVRERLVHFSQSAIVTSPEPR